MLKCFYYINIFLICHFFYQEFRFLKKYCTLILYTKKGFKRSPHQAYFQDLPPSDFFLFCFLEEKLKRKSLADVKEFEETMLDILGSISIEI